MYKEIDVVNWNEIKIKLKNKYSDLTNADLQWRDTDQEDLLKTIANKLRITMKELRGVIKKVN